MEKKTFILMNEEYRSGVCLNEYNGKISICSAHEDEDGTVYLDWIFPQKRDRTASDKSLPWKVELGDYNKAPKVLKRFTKFLDKLATAGEPTTPEPKLSGPPVGKPGPPVKETESTNDDIPF
jgi:hypothetical protein